MTVEYNKRFNHLLCTWETPRPVRYKGRDRVLRRRILKRVRLDRHGNVADADLGKLDDERRRDLLAELARLRAQGELD